MRSMRGTSPVPGTRSIGEAMGVDAFARVALDVITHVPPTAS
jgi:hypothetical protein